MKEPTKSHDQSTGDPRDPASAFALRGMPFTREFSIDTRWCNGAHEDALEGLLQTVNNRMCAGIFGPAGAGKTVLMRALTEKLPEARYRVHYLKVANLSRRDMCREIAAVFGCQEVGQYNSLVRVIQERMRNCVDQDGIRPVLIIDDAHEFRPDVLGLMRVVTNFNMDSRLVVSIILCGQMDLPRMLSRDALKDVSRRLSYCATLRNLSRSETHSYIQKRLTMVGGKEALFAQGAYDALYEIGGGNLRATDRLALAAMYIAAADKSPVVEDVHVVAAKERLWI